MGVRKLGKFKIKMFSFTFSGQRSLTGLSHFTESVTDTPKFFHSSLQNRMGSGSKVDVFYYILTANLSSNYKLFNIPGESASTNAPITRPSFQLLVKLLTVNDGILSLTHANNFSFSAPFLPGLTSVDALLLSSPKLE